MISYENFRKSLNNLAAQQENYRLAGQRSGLSKLDIEALAESVIHRYETCYDALWKTLRRHLREELKLPDVPNSPKPVFRLAHENNLLPGGIEKWLEFADARIDTTHDYSEHKARRCLGLVPEFIDAAGTLLDRISGSG